MLLLLRCGNIHWVRIKIYGSLIFSKANIFYTLAGKSFLASILDFYCHDLKKQNTVSQQEHTSGEDYKHRTTKSKKQNRAAYLFLLE
jgi:hypothetical protein